MFALTVPGRNQCAAAGHRRHISHSDISEDFLSADPDISASTASSHPEKPALHKLISALRDHDAARALEILDRDPGIFRRSIHAAAASANADAVANLLAGDSSLATSADVHWKVEPIICAAHAGLADAMGVDEAQRVRTVQLLLDAGASANASVQTHQEPEPRVPVLYFACVSNNVAVARLLLENGANPNDGESVYHAAEHDHRGCLELLLAYGADVSSAHAQWGNTPLFFLAGYKPEQAHCASSTRGMQWLLEHGADPNVPSYVDNAYPAANASEVPLHRISANGRRDAAQLLLDHGAVVDATRADGRTPYALALRNGHSDVAAVLAAEGANTSLLSPVDRLLAACASANETDARELLASHEGLLSSLTALDRAAIGASIESGRTASVRLMLTLGWSLTEQGPWGGTPLHWAAWFGRPAIARMLLESGAPVNVRDSQYGSSPIAWACHGSRFSPRAHDAEALEIVEMLLDAGATRAESFNNWNEPPESLASDDVASLLRRRGFAPASVDQK